MMLRAAAAACRCRLAPTLLSPKPTLLNYRTRVAGSRHFSSVARERDDDERDAHAAVAKSRSDYWNEMYQELRKFVEKHGHAHVPVQYDENPSLGRWVDAQRHQMRQIQRGETFSYNSLTPERQELLNQVGMVWNIRDYIWEEHYEKLLDFFYTNGHVNVPSRHPDGLGRWVYKQRKGFAARQRGEETPLTVDRMVRLSALGMIWNIPEASWDESYQKLVDYHAEHGHSNVPADASDPFAAWVHIQRREYKRFQSGEYSRMTQDRIDRMNKLQFQWDYQEAVWLEKYEELRRYRREHGDWYDCAHSFRLAIIQLDSIPNNFFR